MTIPLVPVLEPVPLRTEQPEPEFQENVVTFLDALPDYSEAQNAQATAMNETAAAIDEQAEQVAATSESIEDLYALIVASDLGDLTGNSTTSNTVGTGTKTFTATAGKKWRPTLWVDIRSASDPTAFMAGPITAYDVTDGNPLSVDVKATGGSGTKTDWVISATFPPIEREQYELIGTLNTATGTTWTINPLPEDYADLLIEIAGVSHSGGGNSSFDLEVYDGSSWTQVATLVNNVGAATVSKLSVPITGYRQRLAQTATGLSGGGNVTIETSSGIKGLRFKWAAGYTGDAGEIRVWGK